ncbi:hypothetical protein Q8W71_13865 [Methylobacterium sp. NEAU 140]|uniref:hypothetical protein n=1 Tax=Methylobacterium sp. NEAU 140 TaxID=3064945 RepID=UPI002733762B|nr:hypothetical protein [Methylobacterium sp. NEAU 140]MDP4023718.1 hypothetical protein [Methylobacterium sp. NEAU 140]
MAITASSPDAFFESDPWSWDFTVTQADGTTPLDLTGLRLLARFCDQAENAVAVCDSAAANGTLVIPTPSNGGCTFTIPVAGRTYKVPRLNQFTFNDSYKPQIIGVLRCFNAQGVELPAICEITFTVRATPGYVPT